MTREQWKKQHHDQRTQKSIAALDPSVPNAHGHADHGFQTTIEQQTERVQTGRTPSGRNSRPRRATKYDTPELELEAHGRARRLLADASPPTMKTDPRTGNQIPNRVSYEVTRPKGAFGGGVETVNDAHGNPLPGRPVQDAGPYRSAIVVFEFNPATGQWGQYTSYPIPTSANSGAIPPATP